jgi:uncharacterized membrane protein YedE/YeeE
MSGLSDPFLPASALVGGALIGLAASALMILTGRVAGISGIVGGLVWPTRGEWPWRVLFVCGLLVGGLVLLAFAPVTLANPVRSPVVLAVSGLLVGFGARLGRGCTSGHGVCGVARLSVQSLVATGVFMFTGILTVTLMRLLGGG